MGYYSSVMKENSLITKCSCGDQFHGPDASQLAWDCRECKRLWRPFLYSTRVVRLSTEGGETLMKLQKSDETVVITDENGVITEESCWIVVL